MYYYHVCIELNEKNKNNENKQLFQLNYPNIEEIENDIIVPYLNNEQIHFSGYFLNSKQITRILIHESDNTTDYYSQFVNNENVNSGILHFVSDEEIFWFDMYMKDVTKSIFSRFKNVKNKPIIEQKKITDEVFVVHGRDEAALQKVARFLEKLKLKPIILHEQPNAGKTIIEKIESYSNVQYGVVILTPDDLGYIKDNPDKLKFRARQNVLFEHGYLIGKLNRKNVSALLEESVEKPSDIEGIAYIKYDISNNWKLELAKELKNSGFNINMNDAL